MKKKIKNLKHELVKTIYHLIVAIAIFTLVYVINNLTHAASGNLTIINDEPMVQTQNLTSQQPLTYEDISSTSYKLAILHIKI